MIIWAKITEPQTLKYLTNLLQMKGLRWRLGSAFIFSTFCIVSDQFGRSNEYGLFYRSVSSKIMRRWNERRKKRIKRLWFMVDCLVWSGQDLWYTQSIVPFLLVYNQWWRSSHRNDHQIMFKALNKLISENQAPILVGASILFSWWKLKTASF